MRPGKSPAVVAAVASLALILSGSGPRRPPGDGGRDPAPERRALAFLGREVPRWPRENGCFSCHNNGDAARALLAAGKTPLAPAPEALKGTLDWLARPDLWEKAGDDAAFKDEKLARLQFTSALASAVEEGRIADRRALLRAAGSLAEDQEANGSWPIDAAGPVGSPATYGPPLATAMARRALVSADAKRFAPEVAKSERWLRGRPLANTQDAAALLLALPDDRDLGRQAIEWLGRAQGEGGGWGPYARSAPETFDTAVALLALSRVGDRPNVGGMIRRGRAALAASQDEDGSWKETTRPPGGESYAQKISTTAWATLALLATRPAEPAPIKGGGPPGS